MPSHRAMAAAEDPAESSPYPESPGTTEETVIPLLHSSIDFDRYLRLEHLTVKGQNSQYLHSATESARRLWSRTDPHAPGTDRRSAVHLARYLELEAQRIGSFNYKTALRRANVDTYLMALKERSAAGTLRTVKWILYDIGRLVHPGEYPEARTVSAPRGKPIPATSAEEVRGFYALAPTLPPSLRRRLMILLDLCFGAGARPPDFKVLRGSSIVAESAGDCVVAVVRLPNRAGGSRSVPVADPKISERLLQLSGDAGSAYLLASRAGGVDRNATNRISEDLKRAGHRRINALALRNRWLLDLAARVPAALMLQLADVVDARVLADQRQVLPTYGIQHAIALVKESRA